MDRYRGRGCVCFVHCSDQAGGKLSVRVFTSDQTALTNPSSKKHLVRSHKVWNVFEALLQPLSLSLSVSLYAQHVSRPSQRSASLSQTYREKREKFLAAKTLHCFCFCCCLCVCRSAKRRQHNPSLTRPERERERLALYTFRNRNLRYENSNVRRVFCVVSLKYSVASQDGCLHELRCKSVSVPAATSPTWAEKEYSSKSKHMVLKYYCGKIIWVKVE